MENALDEVKGIRQDIEKAAQAERERDGEWKVDDNLTDSSILDNIASVKTSDLSNYRSLVELLAHTRADCAYKKGREATE